MRIEFHLDAIDEGAGLALVGVYAEVDGSGMVFGEEGPFQAGGESGPAPAPQPAAANEFRHLLGASLLQRLAERLVSAAGLVDRARMAVLLVDVRQ